VYAAATPVKKIQVVLHVVQKLDQTHFVLDQAIHQSEIFVGLESFGHMPSMMENYLYML
jgi:hypothetical protein